MNTTSEPGIIEQLAMFRAAHFDRPHIADMVEYYVLSSEPSEIDASEKITSTINKAVDILSKKNIYK